MKKTIYTCDVCKTESDVVIDDEERNYIGGGKEPEGWATLTISVEVPIPTEMSRIADRVTALADQVPNPEVFAKAVGAFMGESDVAMTTPFHGHLRVCTGCQTGPLWDVVQQQVSEAGALGAALGAPGFAIKSPHL